MILDTLSNLEKYTGLHKNFSKAFEFIREKNLKAIEPGKYPIQGDELQCFRFFERRTECK
jgi:beta-galactosidase beta subunit